MARPRRIAALCALLLAAVPAAPAAAATPGTVRGSVVGQLPASGRGEASVRAYSVENGALVRVAAIGRTGRFSLQLPAGGYVLHAVSIRDRAVMSDARVPVSLRAGQRRSGLRVRLRAISVRPSAGVPTLSPAAGTVAAGGVTTYRFDDLTGNTRALAALGRGLPTLVAADVLGNETCSATQLAGDRERAVLASTSRLRSSSSFARSTPIRRALLAPQLAITGTMSPGSSAARAAFTVRIIELSTGATIDTLRGGVRRSGRGLFTDQRRLAAALTERICRRPRSYAVGLTLDARGEYTAYNSTARLASTLTAKTRTPAPYAAWTGGGSFVWTDAVFRSRVSLCTTTKITPGGGTWSATVTALPATQVRVELDLTASEYTAYPKADFVCEPALASATGAPGPLLTGTAPRTFTLPASGGTGTISSTTTLPTGGFIQSGAVTLTPVWGYGLPVA